MNRKLLPEKSVTKIDSLKEFLEQKVEQYNQLHFIESDPISVPHQFKRKEDIELASFFTASIAWGQRITAIKNAVKLMQWMDQSPYDFVLHSGPSDLKQFRHFVHRTFNGEDCIYFIGAMQDFLKTHGSMGNFFQKEYRRSGDLKMVLSSFRNVFFSWKEPGRSSKHLANVEENASAKRLNMMLRWMVRVDKRGVDFGLWKQISPSALYIPLDIHSGNVARSLGLLRRRQSDWKAVEELTTSLREFDPVDPVKYDFALFGLGVFEGFNNKK